MDALTVALSLWFVFPAYVANAVPVLVGGGTPIDLGHCFVDSRRIFGDGKTIRGFAGGLIGGILLGTFEAFTSGYVILGLEKSIVLSLIQAEILQCTPLRAFLISIGALLGDLAGSFIKRRMGLRRGAPVPLLDQLMFLIVALLLVSLTYQVPLEYVIILLILTPLIHLTSNIISYLLGLKKVPW
jgi:CDP-2,3-bis-(O-geranylgeranyl)-sn-glycerol synthase